MWLNGHFGQGFYRDWVGIVSNFITGLFLDYDYANEVLYPAKTQMHNFSCAFPRRACPGLLVRFAPAFVRLKNTDFSAGLTAGDFPRA